MNGAYCLSDFQNREQPYMNWEEELQEENGERVWVLATLDTTGLQETTTIFKETARNEDPRLYYFITLL